MVLPSSSSSACCCFPSLPSWVLLHVLLWAGTAFLQSPLGVCCSFPSSCVVLLSLLFHTPKKKHKCPNPLLLYLIPLSECSRPSKSQRSQESNHDLKCWVLQLSPRPAPVEPEHSTHTPATFTTNWTCGLNLPHHMYFPLCQLERPRPGQRTTTTSLSSDLLEPWHVTLPNHRTCTEPCGKTVFFFVFCFSQRSSSRSCSKPVARHGDASFRRLFQKWLRYHMKTSSRRT